MKILVTGAAGFMGSWLVDELIDNGHNVTGVDNMLGGYERNINKESNFVKLDVRGFDEVQKLCNEVDVIFSFSCICCRRPICFFLLLQ